MSNPKVEEGVEYVPDYKKKCINCGQKPTVTVCRDGKRLSHMDMCGVCTFGSASCIDPEEW